MNPVLRVSVLGPCLERFYDPLEVVLSVDESCDQCFSVWFVSCSVFTILLKRRVDESCDPCFSVWFVS